MTGQQSDGKPGNGVRFGYALYVRLMLDVDFKLIY